MIKLKELLSEKMDKRQACETLKQLIYQENLIDINKVRN